MMMMYALHRRRIRAPQTTLYDISHHAPQHYDLFFVQMKLRKKMNEAMMEEKMKWKERKDETAFMCSEKLKRLYDTKNVE